MLKFPFIVVGSKKMMTEVTTIMSQCREVYIGLRSFSNTASDLWVYEAQWDQSLCEVPFNFYI